VQIATLAFCKELASAGIRVFQYLPGFLHQKLILVDEDFASVGSANLDNRSLKLNFELNVMIPSEVLVKTFDTLFREDLQNSEEISESLKEQSALANFYGQLAKLFSPIL
jgi:cardiolipin synthase A/B